MSKNNTEIWTEQVAVEAMRFHQQFIHILLSDCWDDHEAMCYLDQASDDLGALLFRIEQSGPEGVDFVKSMFDRVSELDSQDHGFLSKKLKPSKDSCNYGKVSIWRRAKRFVLTYLVR